MALVGPLPAGSGIAPWLARNASDNHVHTASEHADGERRKIGPNWRAIQGAVCHARFQDAGCIRFDFHVSDCASVRESKFKSEVKSSDSGTEAKHSGGNEIHISLLQRPRRRSASATASASVGSAAQSRSP